jgi:hypothetical protein
MSVLPVTVGLPDFEHRVGDGNAVSIQYEPVNGHSLADNTFRGEIALIQPL